jgi:hypothetical protein
MRKLDRWRWTNEAVVLVSNLACEAGRRLLEEMLLLLLSEMEREYRSLKPKEMNIHSPVRMMIKAM